MGKAEKLTKAILSSMGKEEDPIRILIEAVLEKEFKAYEDLLKDCKRAFEDDRITIKQEMDLVGKIDTQLNEGKLRGPVND